MCVPFRQFLARRIEININFNRIKIDIPEKQYHIYRKSNYTVTEGSEGIRNSKNLRTPPKKIRKNLKIFKILEKKSKIKDQRVAEPPDSHINVNKCWSWSSQPSANAPEDVGPSRYRNKCKKSIVNKLIFKCFYHQRSFQFGNEET